MSDAVMVPRAWLLKVVDTLKPFSEVAEKLRRCHVVEICEPHPDNPSPNIAVMPREWLERAGDDLEAAVIVLHRDGALSEGQAAKLIGLDRVEVRKLSDALAASPSVGGWEEPVAQPSVADIVAVFRANLFACHEHDDRTLPIEIVNWGDAERELLALYAAPPPPSVSIDDGSRPQEAVPTEGPDAAVLDRIHWLCEGAQPSDYAVVLAAIREAAAPVDHMVQRFLSWRLPEDFNPDNGISFKPTFNDHMDPPMRCNPTGTNLFDARQAEAMVRHMLAGEAS